MARAKRYKLGGSFVFRDVDGVVHRLEAGTELGPDAMRSFNAAEIAIHIRQGMFLEIPPEPRSLGARARGLLIRTT